MFFLLTLMERVIKIDMIVMKMVSITVPRNGRLNFKLFIMNIKQRILFVLLVGFLLGACNGSKTMTSGGLNNEIPKDSLIELESFVGKPDSVLTTIQFETKKKFIVFLETHLKVVDNYFVLDAEQQDFEKAGLSKYYYNLLNDRLVEVNHFVDSLGVKDLAKKYKEGSIENGLTF